MIKVKLIEKSKDKNGDSIREIISEKEFKKNNNYQSFISELSKAFSIPKNKFILIGLIDEDENPINDQDDLDTYLEDTKEFMIIIEKGSLKVKPNKKTKAKKNINSENDDDKNDNDSIKDKGKKKEDEEEEKEEEKEEGEGEEDYLKKIKINANMEISEQEIEKIMNGVKMPEIDDINDDIEFNIEKYKTDLNNKNNSKIHDFKNVFETHIKKLIKEKRKK